MVAVNFLSGSNKKKLMPRHATNNSSNTSSSEGTDVKSTGETGTTKFLRVDGDGTCSWQSVSASLQGTATGAINFDSQDMTNVDIDSGTIDGTIIGGSSAAAITCTSLSCSDGNITNVGSLACDSIGVDDASVGLTINFAGNNATSNITLVDDRLDALSIKEGSNTYMRFVTDDGNEAVALGKTLNMSSQPITGCAALTCTSLSCSDGNITNVGQLRITETGSAGSHTAGEGQIWVLDSSPNKLYFQDDTGVNFPLLRPTATQVLEVIAGVCDGRSVVGASGTYVMPTITAGQTLTDTFADATGSSIDYVPPTGTKQVIFEWTFSMALVDQHGMSHFRFMIDDNSGTPSEMEHARVTIGANSYYGEQHTLKYVLDIGTVGSTTAETLKSGQLQTWTSARTLKLQCRQFSSTNTLMLHELKYWDGAADGGIISKPSIMVTAIGVPS